MSAKIPAVEAWVRKAENGFKNIRDSLRGGDPTWDTVCYHAQQGGEKYLKACLIAQGIEPPRVHDLEELLTLCAVSDETLQALAADCAALSDYAVGVRYPGLHEPGETDGRSAVAAAERIRAAIRFRLSLS